MYYVYYCILNKSYTFNNLWYVLVLVDWHRTMRELMWQILTDKINTCSYSNNMSEITQQKTNDFIFKLYL